jgi:Na+/H+ antiporter NhaD/arsenite permease-like protein
MMSQTTFALPRARLRRLAPNSDNWLLWILASAAVAFALIRPQPPMSELRLIDWNTVGALTGLMVLTKGMELSGALQIAARRLLARATDLRQLVLLLVALAASSSAVVTNDASLFLFVPLTKALAGNAQIPLARVVTYEASAVNAGSALTPIGNPQNIFLWQQSGMDFARYTLMMVPTAGIMLTLLVATVILLVPRTSIEKQMTGPTRSRSPHLFWTSLGLFGGFLLALEFHFLLPALLVVLIIYATLFRRVLADVDWALLLIIALMFVDLRQLADLPTVSSWFRALPLGSGLQTYVSAIVTSQLISNVPAAVVLERWAHHLPALASGVSIGGLGLCIGSLANLIALRLAGAPGGLWEFHRVSIPMLLISGAAGALLWST